MIVILKIGQLVCGGIMGRAVVKLRQSLRGRTFPVIPIVSLTMYFLNLLSLRSQVMIMINEDSIIDFMQMGVIVFGIFCLVIIVGAILVGKYGSRK